MSADDLSGDREHHDRECIVVTPSTSSLSVERVISKTKQLHSLCSDKGDGLLSGLRSSGDDTRIECRLISPEEGKVEYVFGLDGGDTGSIEAFEDILRLIFPDDYEFARRDAPRHFPDTSTGERYVAGVEYSGLSDYRKDWQMPLTPLDEPQEQGDESGFDRSPLAAIVESMAQTELHVVFQVLIRPRNNWQSAAKKRIRLINTAKDTYRGKIGGLFEGPDVDHTLTETAKRRKEAIRRRDTRRSFVINARAAVIAEPDEALTAESVATGLQSAFGHIAGDFHEVTGVLRTDESAEADGPGSDLLQDIRDLTFYPQRYQRLATLNPLTANVSKGILVDASELGHFIAIDGSSLPTDAERALETTPQSKTAIGKPPKSHLEPYWETGMALGRPLDQDGSPAKSWIGVPADLQTHHIAVNGRTGAGKSAGLISMVLSNSIHTDGPEIVIDPKGGGFVSEYLQSHYAAWDTLENVLYFDCADWLPAISFFDIQTDLDAGVKRHIAIKQRIDHYIEVLRHLAGSEQFDRALQAPKVIRYTLKALYDPHYQDSPVTQERLFSTVDRMHTERAIPPVTNDRLKTKLEGFFTDKDDLFESQMIGAKNRIDEAQVLPPLEALFNYNPEEGPEFDLQDLLNEQRVIIFDLGRFHSETKRALTLVLLSQIWSALRRRKRQDRQGDLPLVNLYLEEAPSVAASDILTELLSRGREFGLGVTLATQFPEQLEQENERAYAEVLNDVGTHLTGNVGLDRDLAARLATAEMDDETVAQRLRGLSGGQWMVNLPGAFFGEEPDPFLLQSLPLPEGHPATRSHPPEGYASARKQLATRSRDSFGIDLGEVQGTHEKSAVQADGHLSVEHGSLPAVFELTTRMPDPVIYEGDSNALRCATCGSRYRPALRGMNNAIRCCASLAEADRDNIPICSYHLKLSADEIEASQFNVRQLAFLQVVRNAQQLRYDPIEYDIVSDSMLRLKEYVGISPSEIDELLEAEVLKKDHSRDHPHRLYSITNDGKNVIKEYDREGVNFGDGKGDLGESSLHVCLVEGTRRLFEQYRADPTSPVASVETYFELDGSRLSGAASVEEMDDRRLDLVALDESGEIYATAEAELINNDVGRAAPKDYDTMAACEPEEAIWVTTSQAAGYDLLQALTNPVEGEPRVQKTYSSTTPPQQYTIERPGLTDIYPINHVTKLIGEDSPGKA